MAWLCFVLAQLCLEFLPAKKLGFGEYTSSFCTALFLSTAFGVAMLIPSCVGIRIGGKGEGIFCDYVVLLEDRDNATPCTVIVLSSVYFLI